MSRNGPDFAKIVLNYSNLHQIRRDSEGLTVTTDIGLEKCACGWIGWSHAEHQAGVIGEAIAAVVDTAVDVFFGGK